MFVYRVEYSIQDSENWRANVLGENEKDVVEFLTKFVGQPIKINFMDQYQKVNGITDSIVQKILDKHKRIEEAKKKEVKTDKPIEDKKDNKQKENKKPVENNLPANKIEE